MANHKSATKAHRQSLLRRTRNRNNRSRYRSALKACRQAIHDGDLEGAKSMLPATLALTDRTAQLGAIHRSVAQRTKSRLQRAVNRLAAAGS